jgi:hypothetical protein
MAIEYLIAQYSIAISVAVRSSAIISASYKSLNQKKKCHRTVEEHTNKQVNNVNKITKSGLGGEIGRGRGTLLRSIECSLRITDPSSALPLDLIC